MQTENLVSADQYVSDDSDFYGSTSGSPANDINKYLGYHGHLPTVLANNSAAASAPAKASYNRFQGRPTSGKQLEESIDAFVLRLPPSATFDQSVIADEINPPEDSAWIWCDNPNNDTDTAVDQDTGGFLRAGREALYQYLDLKSELAFELDQNKEGRSLSKLLAQPQGELGKRLKALGRQYGVRTGKWMIFCTPDRVDKVWKRVCEGVVDDLLGPSAKVSRRQPKDEAGAQKSNQREEHVICIYTKDFENEEDVRRVLFGLRDLGLVSRGDAKGIWYKADAWTLLDIKRNNEYGLKASLYGSVAMLGATKK